MVQVRWLTRGTPSATDGTTVARPEGPAPFTSLALTSEATPFESHLVEQGWVVAPASHADALRLLAGWPALGHEIDERTLPQEVRFDELGGVKYDKGCYTGQETVARLHFRGHANRALRAVRWESGAEPTALDLRAGDKDVGTIRTIAQLGDQLVTLAILRREIVPGNSVRAGDGEGIVVPLPITPDAHSVA